jgi:hypothetical protein
MGSLILPTDTLELQWFFTTGLCSVQRSPFGAQLEKMERFAYRTVPCGTCSAGAEKLDPDQIVLPRTPGFTVDGELCDACEGRGVLIRRGASNKNASITVRPSRSSADHAATHDDELERARFVNLSRKLRKCTARTFDIFSAMYGAVGQLFLRTSGDARIALYPMTTAGRDLLGEFGDDDVAPQVVIGRLVRDDEIFDEPGRRARLRAAGAEAMDLAHASECEWLCANDVRQGNRFDDGCSRAGVA